MKQSKFILITVLVAFIILWPLLKNPGFPYTHDGQNHMARMANYYLALKQGQFPPRWAPNLDAGMGYTSLNFNYPLANILSVPLIAINLGVENSLILLFSLFLILSGIGMYLFLSNRYQGKAAMLGSIAYVINPYQLANIYVRGNIGESMSFGLLPWVFFLIQQIIKYNQSKIYKILFIIFFSAFLLSHNLIVLLSLPFILFVGLSYSKFDSLKYFIKPVIISFLIVSFFWVPALGEKDFTVLTSSPLSTANFSSHFPTFRQLILGSWDHGFSYPVNVDGMTFSSGLLGLIAVFLTIPTLMIFKTKKAFEKFLLFIFIMTSFLMNKYSWNLWKLFPILSIIQFPWRLLFFTSFTSSVLLAFVVDKTKLSKFIGLIAIITVMFISQNNLGINFTKNSDDYWFNFPLNTTILNENDPIWLDRNQAYQIKDSSDEFIIASNPVDVDYYKFNGSYKRYAVTSNTPTTITEKTMYFPGWETRVNGNKIDIESLSQRKAGLINYDISAGEYLVETKFTQNTKFRIIGNTLSIIGFILLLFQFKPHIKTISQTIKKGR